MFYKHHGLPSGLVTAAHQKDIRTQGPTIRTQGRQPGTVEPTPEAVEAPDHIVDGFRWKEQPLTELEKIPARVLPEGQVGSADERKVVAHGEVARAIDKKSDFEPTDW